MTIETFKQAQNLMNSIDELKVKTRRLRDLSDEAKEANIKTRVYGFDIELPRNMFKSQLNAARIELQTQLDTLQAEFDAL